MSRDLVVIGAGGFGRETLDVAEAAIRAGAGFRILGVIDGSPSEHNLQRLEARGIAYLGTEAHWLAGQPNSVEYVIGVGSPAAKEIIANRFDSAGLSAATLIHPMAAIGTMARIGPGSVVCGGVQISTNVHTARHVHVNPGAIIGHDAVIDEFASVNPGAVISGEVHLGKGSLIGAGAVVLQGLWVGQGATVGAAACVVREVAPGVVVKGVPAR